MTDKERLELINNFSSLPLKKRISLTKESIKKELKANDYHMPKNININTQYLLEIIEQAERGQELEEKTKKLQAFYDYWAELYGKGLEVANWHMNGDLELFDDFFDSAEEWMEGEWND